MKYLSILALLLFTLNSSCAQNQLTINSDLVEVSFDSSLDKAALMDIKAKLSNLDIQLEYESLEFNEKGKLKSISFSVDCNDGFKGSASSKFLTKINTVGFYRDYREDAKKSFGTGTRKRTD